MAGRSASRRAGTAARIFTGAPIFPPGRRIPSEQMDEMGRRVISFPPIHQKQDFAQTTRVECDPHVAGRGTCRRFRRTRIIAWPASVPDAAGHGLAASRWRIQYTLRCISALHGVKLGPVFTSGSPRSHGFDAGASPAGRGLHISQLQTPGLTLRGLGDSAMSAARCAIYGIFSFPMDFSTRPQATPHGNVCAGLRELVAHLIVT